ncbi:MAG: hypothetical protein J7605_25410 [Variovorax sp.]|nr:hypothetical protein [Variovorax sp.]
MRILSDWASVRVWETKVERDLHRTYNLRAHGLSIGTLTLLVTWLVSHLLMLFGVDSLAVRYVVALGAGYGVYLLVLRWWAERLVRRNAQFNPDVPDPGVFEWNSPRSSGASAIHHPSGTGASDIASGALEAAGSVDEGVVVVVPVVAIFLVCAAIVFGAGALALLYFGWDALLAVAIELAFSYVSARAAIRVAREGWFAVAVRLTWKPLLGALFCAVVLGAVIDRFMPQVNSLPAAVHQLLHR